jgi:hypothetical protein
VKKQQVNDKVVRRLQTDQLMFRMAALLQEQYRGVYADLKGINNKYIEEW